MKKYIYFYAMIIPIPTGANYKSGTIESNILIKENKDFNLLADDIAKQYNLDKNDYAFITFNRL